MRRNSVVIDTTYGIIGFPHLTMQVKCAASKTTAKRRAGFPFDSITVPPMMTTTTTAFVDHHPNDIQQVL